MLNIGQRNAAIDANDQAPGGIAMQDPHGGIGMTMGKCGREQVQRNQGSDLWTEELSRAPVEPGGMFNLVPHLRTDLIDGIISSREHIDCEL